MPHFQSRSAVIAFGGNAISPPDELDTIPNQFRHARHSLGGIVELLKRGYNLAITHGNGPQVGTALRRVELAGSELPVVPLGVLVADTQGSIGYVIEQSLQNRMVSEDVHRRVVTIITQVLVDENDPALSNPTKYIGQIYTRQEAERYIREEGWVMKPFDGEEQWRRVVGSPRPLGIVNRKAVRQLVQEGVIIIAGGGGGIPVYRNTESGLAGIDAVIDKDLVAAILAHDIEAEELIILTNIDTVRLDYRKPTEKVIRRMRVREAREHLAQGQFPAGSMGPKVEAAAEFVERGGERAIICALDQLETAINTQAGTEIIP